MNEYASDDFWAAYAEYLIEAQPRHQRIVTMLTQDVTANIQNSLLDLGCGKHCSARALLKPQTYYGVDMDPPIIDPQVLRGDFRQSFDMLNPDNPTAFTSLFAAEVTGDSWDNYDLYAKVFKRWPSIEWGLVSGFYYNNERSAVRIGESGGLVSYQSVSNVWDVTCDGFDETRIEVRAPSKLFGPDVVEVWKLFDRWPDLAPPKWKLEVGAVVRCVRTGKVHVLTHSRDCGLWWYMDGGPMHTDCDNIGPGNTFEPYYD